MLVYGWKGDYLAYMFSKFILFGGLVASLGLGGFNVNETQEANHQFILENHKSVAYFDDDYEIILSAYELNNYVFTNLSTYLNSLTSVNFQDLYVSYGGEDWAYDDFTRSESLTFVYNDVNFVRLDLEAVSELYSHFLLTNDTFENLVDFEYDLSFNFIELSSPTDIYNAFKQAIELDIEANTQGNMPTASDIFAQITAGVTGFVGSLGQAFTSVVALFWDSTNSAPTFIGLLMLLAIGAGLIYLAIRFVMGLVRRLRG